MIVYVCDGIGTDPNQNCFWYDTSSISKEIPEVCPNCGAKIIKIEEDKDEED